MKEEFKIGDRVWWATSENKQVTVDCPVCFGKKLVTIIFGNEERFQTDCRYCDIGYSGSKGYVNEYKRVSDVQEIVIDGKEINENEKGRIVEYRYGHYILREGTIFATKKEAEERVKEMITEYEISESERIARAKVFDAKSYAWHVGYHQKKAKDAQIDLEYHKKKVVACKLLAKKKPALKH